jgi:hypothetical protein
MNEDDTAPQWHGTRAWSHTLKTKIEGVFGLSMERVFLSIERQFGVKQLIQCVDSIVDSWPIPFIQHPLIMSSVKKFNNAGPRIAGSQHTRRGDERGFAASGRLRRPVRRGRGAHPRV